MWGRSPQGLVAETPLAPSGASPGVGTWSWCFFSWTAKVGNGVIFVGLVRVGFLGCPRMIAVVVGYVQAWRVPDTADRCMCSGDAVLQGSCSKAVADW